MVHVEYLYFYELGVDGVFSENLARAQEARTLYLISLNSSQNQQRSLQSIVSRKGIFLLIASGVLGGIVGWWLSSLLTSNNSLSSKNSHSKKHSLNSASQAKKLLTAPAQ
jgi:hypothetical protein